MFSKNKKSIIDFDFFKLSFLLEVVVAIFYLRRQTTYLRHWNVSEKKFVEKIKTDIMFIKIFLKNCAVWGEVEKYSRVGQATDDNGACALHVGYLRLQTHTRNM
jgi:hypothetical protein